MAQLYAMNVTPLLDGSWEALMPQLSHWRQKKVMSLRHGADRARSAAAGWLLDHALSQAGVPKAQRAIRLQPGGKPVLAQGGLHFSLSHAGSWAVCALGENPLGVDVELPRCTLATARRFICPGGGGPGGGPAGRRPAGRPAAALTAKEAFTKALGQGLSLGLHTFEVRLADTGAALRQSATPLPYRLEEYPLLPSWVCLCTVEPRPALTMVQWHDR